MVKMWHEARRQEKKLRGMLVDYRKRAERRRDFYEKIKADPTQFLQLHGRPCKIHLDSAVAQAADSPATMMPWQGHADTLIDRFDVRAHLDYIPPVVPNQTSEETHEERQCNYERYRILAQNIFLGVNEEKFLKQLHLEEQFGYTASKNEEKKLKTGVAIGFNYEEPGKDNLIKTDHNDSDSSDSDSDLDVDLCIDMSKIEQSQAHELNRCGQQFGMCSNDFYSFLINDMEEAENIRIAREEEHEKALYSGRKSRRERRAHRERRLANRIPSPPSYAARASPTYPAFRESKSNSKSPTPENTGQITYITSFGGEDEVPSTSKPQTYAEKVKFGKKKSAETREKKVRKRSRSSSNSLKNHHRYHRSKSLSRSRSRSRSRTPRLKKRRSDESFSPRRSRSKNYVSKNRYSRSRSRNRSFSRSRSRSPYTSKLRRKTTPSPSRSHSRNYKRNVGDSPRRNKNYSKKSRSRSRSRSSKRYRQYSRNRKSRSYSPKNYTSTKTRNKSKSISPRNRFTSKNYRSKKSKNSVSSSSSSSRSRSPSPKNSKLTNYASKSSSRSKSNSPNKKYRRNHSSRSLSRSKSPKNNKTEKYRKRSKNRSSRSVSSSSSVSTKSNSSKSLKSRTKSRSRSRSKSRLQSRSRSKSRSKSIVKELKISPKSPPKRAESPRPIQRYYGRRQEDKSSSDLSDLDETEPKNSESNVGSSEKSSSVFGNSGSASKVPIIAPMTKLTPQERLKRKMQLLLNKQYKADKIAEQIRTERAQQEQRNREDELREMALKLRRKQRERRHAYDENSNSSNSNSSDESSKPSEENKRSLTPDSPKPMRKVRKDDDISKLSSPYRKSKSKSPKARSPKRSTIQRNNIESEKSTSRYDDDKYIRYKSKNSDSPTSSSSSDYRKKRDRSDRDKDRDRDYERDRDRDRRDDIKKYKSLVDY